MDNNYPQSPILFKQCLLNWKTFQRWSPEYIAQSTANKKVKFKIGKRNETRETSVNRSGDRVIFDTIANFLQWCRGIARDEFTEFDTDNNWAYCSYEYVNELFQSVPQLIDDIDWSFFGLPSHLNNQTVFWIGSEGSFTDCHFDSYGWNLVCQLRGRKKWVLFPPEDTRNLYPTRVPFEESSVFSAVDFTNPDPARYPRLAASRPRVADLGPGDALFVPRHWWHFVRNETSSDTDPCSLSINLWLDHPRLDDENRMLECLSRSALFSCLDSGLALELSPSVLSSVHGFLSSDDDDDDGWVSGVLRQLNNLLVTPVDGCDTRESVSFSQIFEMFSGEELESREFLQVFPMANFESSSMADRCIRTVSALDLVDCFTHPDVIKEVARVLKEKIQVLNNDNQNEL